MRDSRSSLERIDEIWTTRCGCPRESCKSYSSLARHSSARLWAERSGSTTCAWPVPVFLEWSVCLSAWLAFPNERQVHFARQTHRQTNTHTKQEKFDNNNTDLVVVVDNNKRIREHPANFSGLVRCLSSSSVRRTSSNFNLCSISYNSIKPDNFSLHNNSPIWLNVICIDHTTGRYEADIKPTSLPRDKIWPGHIWPIQQYWKSDIRRRPTDIQRDIKLITQYKLPIKTSN